MENKCPFCGSDRVERTFNFNESICNMCGCDFKVFEGGRVRIFNDGSWRKFCESVSEHSSRKTRIPQLNHFIHTLFNEYSKKTPNELDLLIDTLVEHADSLYRDYKAGMIDSYAFQTVLEAIDMLESAGKTISLREDLDWDIRIDEEPDEFGDDMETMDLSGEIHPDDPRAGYDDEELPAAMGYDDDDDPRSPNYATQQGMNQQQDDEAQEAYEDVEKYLDQGMDIQQAIFKVANEWNYDPEYIEQLYFQVNQNGEELEEDHLDDYIDNVEDSLDDVDDRVSDVETKGDLDDVEDEIDDVEDEIDDLWRAYGDSYEDGGEFEDDEMGGMDFGDEEMDGDIGLGGDEELDDVEGDEELDLDVSPDEEGEEDIDAEDGGEVPNDEPNPFQEEENYGPSDAKNLIVMTRNNNGEVTKNENGEWISQFSSSEDMINFIKKLREAYPNAPIYVRRLEVSLLKAFEDSINESYVGDKKHPSKPKGEFRKTREGNVYSSYKSKDEHQIGSIEDGSDAVEDEEEIPYTEEEDAYGTNQFGDSKLSTSRGAVNSRPKGEDFVKNGKPDGKGLGIRESYNGFTIGDKVFISESRDEWTIKKIKGNKARVQRGETSTIVDLLDESVRHADRGIAAHRERDLMRESKRAWEQIEHHINESGCVGGVCGLGGSGGPGNGMQIGGTLVSPMSSIAMTGPGSIDSNSIPSGVADKSEVYRYIKDNDLHRSPRDHAYNLVMTEFNNPIEEINQILDDAILSNDANQVESIDNLYSYKTSEMRAFEENKRIKDAYRLIEKDNQRNLSKINKERKKYLKEQKISRRNEQNNDPILENLGRTWLNRISEGLEDV
jgi:transcription initiation factor TFIIIB Brf1 subunit/transcription initiation factor TFIIB